MHKLFQAGSMNMSMSVHQWPPQRPDLNPIEHLWDVVERVICSPVCSWQICINVMQSCKHGSDRILKENHLVVFMPQRIEAVLKAKAGLTQYTYDVPNKVASACQHWLHACTVEILRWIQLHEMNDHYIKHYLSNYAATTMLYCGGWGPQHDQEYWVSAKHSTFFKVSMFNFGLIRQDNLCVECPWYGCPVKNLSYLNCGSL